MDPSKNRQEVQWGCGEDALPHFAGGVWDDAASEEGKVTPSIQSKTTSGFLTAISFLGVYYSCVYV